jgi:hypothetical protein
LSRVRVAPAYSALKADRKASAAIRSWNATLIVALSPETSYRNEEGWIRRSSSHRRIVAIRSDKSAARNRTETACTGHLRPE